MPLIGSKARRQQPPTHTEVRAARIIIDFEKARKDLLKEQQKDANRFSEARPTPVPILRYNCLLDTIILVLLGLAVIATIFAALMLVHP